MPRPRRPKVRLQAGPLLLDRNPSHLDLQVFRHVLETGVRLKEPNVWIERCPNQIVEVSTTVKHGSRIFYAFP